MSTEGISSSQIDSMLALLRNVAAQASPPSGGGSVGSVIGADATGATEPANGVSFAQVLKNSIGQVNQVQETAQQMADQFASGNDNVSLSDVMIASQKANISLQMAVQVRNRLVSAYNDMMNMQI